MNETNPQLVQEVVKKLEYFADYYGIDSLFIAGGYCRSLYSGDLTSVNDIDVAAAYSGQAVMLGGLFASEVAKTVPRFYHRTSTAMIEYESEFGKIKVEFQSSSPQPYMQNRQIRDWVHKNEIDDVPLMHNIYGRDFTINSMIYSLDMKTLLDPSGHAVADFEAGVIKSLIPPAMLIRYNPIAALRAIRFALTYDFKIDRYLAKMMRYAPKLLIKQYTEERLMKEIVRILNIDATEAMKLFKRYNLEKVLFLPSIKEYLESLSDEE